MKSFFLFLAFSISASGCTTMSAIETAGDELSKGNVVAGLWTGTMGVFLGAVVDVVTLGGVMDVEDGAQVWTDVSVQKAQVDAQRKQASAERAKRQLEQPILPLSPITTTTSTQSPLPLTTQVQQQLTESESSITSGISTRNYREATHCISIDRTSNALAHFIINSCNFDVHYTYVIPSSSKLCRIGSPCGFKIAANQKQSNTNHREAIRFVACEYPARPKAIDGSRWIGNSTSFRCSN